jgi:hypothetical protein
LQGNARLRAEADEKAGTKFSYRACRRQPQEGSKSTRRLAGS